MRSNPCQLRRLKRRKPTANSFDRHLRTTARPEHLILLPDQKDWSRKIEQLAGLYCDPVILTSPKDASVYQNGSGFLFKPGNRTFLVTNAHVLIEGYEKILATTRLAEFRFGDVTFAPKVIAINAEANIDIAVIDVDDIKFAEREPGYWGSNVGSLNAFIPLTWPSAAPEHGEKIVSVGWPAKFRAHESDGVEFAAFPFLGHQIDHVDRAWFSIPFERTEWTSTDFDEKNPALLETAFGGMSGAPVFSLHRGGVVPLQLIGIVRTYGEGLDILYCTRADIIRTDGTLAI